MNKQAGEQHKANQNAAVRKSKEQLKALFKNNSKPDEEAFADLIDAFVHENEIPALRHEHIHHHDVKEETKEKPEAPPESTAHWHKESGRIGVYDVRKGPNQLPRPQNLVSVQVPANGLWHPIMVDLKDCYCFEIVASASGKAAGSNHAITHAIVLLSFEGYSKGIRQTASYRGWYWGRRIKLSWRKHGGHYDLGIRTGCNFGLDEEGRPVMIQYHVTRLW